MSGCASKARHLRACASGREHRFSARSSSWWITAASFGRSSGFLQESRRSYWRPFLCSSLSRRSHFGEVPVNRAGAAALLIAAVTWSIATILTKRIPLPASKPMSAAAQMLTGGVQLFIVAAISGEIRGFHFDSVSTAAWFSLIYLIFAGSIAGFTAYIWLLHYE